MSNFVTLSALDLDNGQEISHEFLSLFIDRTSVHKSGNQWTGDFVKFINVNDHIENANHLQQAPDGVQIYICEHYVGNMICIKNNGRWYATRISILPSF